MVRKYWWLFHNSSSDSCASCMANRKFTSTLHIKVICNGGQVQYLKAFLVSLDQTFCKFFLVTCCMRSSAGTCCSFYLGEKRDWWGNNCLQLACQKLQNIMPKFKLNSNLSLTLVMMLFLLMLLQLLLFSNCCGVRITKHLFWNFLIFLNTYFLIFRKHIIYRLNNYLWGANSKFVSGLITPTFQQLFCYTVSTRPAVCVFFD